MVIAIILIVLAIAGVLVALRCFEHELIDIKNRLKIRNDIPEEWKKYINSEVKKQAKKEAYICRENFLEHEWLIDDIVERIKRKQLK